MTLVVTVFAKKKFSIFHLLKSFTLKIIYDWDFVNHLLQIGILTSCEILITKQVSLSLFYPVFYQVISKKLTGELDYKILLESCMAEDEIDFFEYLLHQWLPRLPSRLL